MIDWQKLSSFAASTEAPPCAADAPRHRGVRNVLLDLDDTLWENNLFFLASLDWLCREGRRLGFADAATMQIIEHWESFNIHWRGFGYDSYGASFLATLRTLCARAGADDRHAGLHRQGLKWIAYLKSHPIVWRSGVHDTLPELCTRFRTIIVTKGNFHDQSGKVDRSGERHRFAAVEVVPHKNVACYRAVLEKHGLDPAETVMVGNSPRSDINMAKATGLRTVYIPHAQTWHREMEPIRADGPATITIHHFAHLLAVLEP